MSKVLSLATLAALAGCLTLEEIPQATARIEGVMPCVGCRDPEAVVVTLVGDDALPGATIVVYDLRIEHELGQRPATVLRADQDGRWRSVLRSLRLPGRVELPIMPGDVLEVFQKNGEGDASVPYRITVPAQERARGDAPPLIPSEPGLQAADPGTNPAGP